MAATVPKPRQRVAWWWPMTVVVVAAVVFLPGLSHPPAGFWDENYHIASAQKYLHGVFFMEPHPPLGKLLIALGEWALGKNSALDPTSMIGVDHIANFPTGYDFLGARLPSAVCLVVAAFAFFGCCLRICRRAWLAAAWSLLFVLDNALVVHGRSAMLEGPQILFVLASLWWFLRTIDQCTGVRVVDYVLLALAVGLALATKINSGVLFLLFPALWLVDEWRRGTRWIAWRQGLWRHVASRLATRGAIAASVMGLVFCSAYYLHIGLGARVENGLWYQASPNYRQIIADGETWQPQHFPGLLVEHLEFISHYQRGVPKLDPTRLDEAGSLPWQWLVGGKQISYRWDRNLGRTAYVYLSVNPVVWLVGLVAIVVGHAWWIARLGFGAQIRDRRRFLIAVLLLTVHAAYFVTVLRVDRVLYLYHYLLPLQFCLLAGLVLFDELFDDALKRGDRRIVAGLACLGGALIVAFLHFAPLTFAQPVTHSEFAEREWLEIWGLRDAE